MIVSARFINRDNNTYSKEYFYIIENWLESYIRDYRINRKEEDKIIFNTFTIENESGYDYRKAEVIFTRVIDLEDLKRENLRTITNLKLESTFIVNTKKELYITEKEGKNHSLNVEREEKNMLKRMMRNIEFGKNGLLDFAGDGGLPVVLPAVFGDYGQAYKAGRPGAAVDGGIALGRIIRIPGDG